MTDTSLTTLWRIGSSLQALAMLFVCCMTLALGATLALSLAGLVPGLAVTLYLSNGTAFTAGPLLHGIAFLISLMLVAYMPANWRMRRLEAAHRSFRIGMEDVTRAYEVAHAADRAGLFSMASEYDAVRERLGFLAEHPDLGHLEPEILEVAAQMSRVSEDLASTYSDDAVARAKAFLTARQDEVARMDARIEKALVASRDLKQWHERLSMDEDVTRSRLARLKAELDEVLPAIGIAPEDISTTPGVVHLPTRTVAAE